MCNAFNHPPGCNCGWGGEGHVGDRGDRSANNTINHPSSPIYKISKSFVWQKNDLDDFCKPSICPKCGEKVYFVRHNGGCIWLDSLGHPWPEHACFDDQSFFNIRKNLSKNENKLFGLITNIGILDNVENAIIEIYCNDGERLKGVFTYHGDIKYWLGCLVSIRKFGKLIGVTNSDDTIDVLLIN